MPRFWKLDAKILGCIATNNGKNFIVHRGAISSIVSVSSFTHPQIELT